MKYMDSRERVVMSLVSGCVVGFVGQVVSTVTGVVVSVIKPTCPE